VPKVMRSTIRVPSWLAGLAFLILAAATFATPARAAEDVVHFGNSIEVGPNQQIHDAVCFFCSVHVRGTANHDIVVFFGSVTIDGQAEHDVVDFFGHVRVADGSSISHDLVNFFGATWLGENASIGQDAVVMFGSLHEAGTASVGKNQVVEPGILFWGPFVLIFLAISAVVRQARRARYMRMMRGF
jgi:hypothetical protein